MAAILVLAVWLFAQQPLGGIEGTAVRAGTAQPIPNLRVELWPTTLFANTDVNGKYAFQGVEPGDYTLYAETNGIRSRTAVKVFPGQKLVGMAMPVNFAPTIAGTIFDNNGERTAGVRVQAFQMRYSAYGRRVRAVASTLTNDRGEYRLARLHPGEYYVSASYSDIDQRLAKGDLKLTPNLSKPDEGLPPIYFGGAFNPNSSAKVVLRPDLDSTNIDIFLKEGKRFSVSGEIVQGCARLALVPEGGSLNTATDFVHSFCNSFTIKNVAPGTYFLVAIREGFSSEPVRFSVFSQDARDVKVTLIQAVTITGQISYEGQPRGFGGGGARGARGNPFVTDADWGETRVILARNSRDFEWKTGGRILPDGSFHISEVGVGSYDVLVEPMPQRMFLKSVRGGAQDLLVNPLRINSNFPPSLDIVLSSMGAAVEGVVVDRTGKPAPGAQVVLIPVSTGREDLYKTAWANGQGKFRIEGISPGGYSALAFEDIPPDAPFAVAFDPAMTTIRTSGRATMLRIGDSGQAELKLTMIPAAETDGVLR
jgi:hypothetical protein